MASATMAEKIFSLDFPAFVERPAAHTSAEKELQNQ
jgi:hypothetical protein